VARRQNEPLFCSIYSALGSASLYVDGYEVLTLVWSRLVMAWRDVCLSHPIHLSRRQLYLVVHAKPVSVLCGKGGLSLTILHRVVSYRVVSWYASSQSIKRPVSREIRQDLVTEHESTVV
jgi:hypothetical protein